MKLPQKKILYFLTCIQLILIAIFASVTIKAQPAGYLDETFQAEIYRLSPIGAKILASGQNAIVQPDGKILASGDFDFANGKSRKNLVRFNADGTLDSSFLPSIGNFGVKILKLQSDGKILYLNPFSENLTRLNSDGSLDKVFPDTSLSGDFEVLANNKILLSRHINNELNEIVLLNSNGTQDTSFATSINGSVNLIEKQSDGKIMIGGIFTTVNGVYRNNFARLNSDGTLDMNFEPPHQLELFNVPYDLAIQNDGKIIITGQFSDGSDSEDTKYILRLNSNGTFDENFSVSVNIPSHSPDFILYLIGKVKLFPDGKILIGGEFTSIENVSIKGFARLNPDGTLDRTFNNGEGANGLLLDFDFQTDGKIIGIGRFTRINGKTAFSIARILSKPNITPFDFNGDGKADVSVFRPSNNNWFILESGNDSTLQGHFGINNDILAPADYDGDGKIDPAIFRPTDGSWWYLSSIDNTQQTVRFGADGDIPIPSDINNDGKADFVVYRPSNNVWYRQTSDNGSFSAFTFGTNEDKPVSGDFDGDGKSDAAIFRPASGEWWYQSSIDNSQSVKRWGISTDITVPADYDGDGITDFAVYRPTEGGWYILNSSTGEATIMSFGTAEDKPVPADYDGDGKADIAVFRPSTGIWYLLQITNGFDGLQFGVETDVPIPNAFIQP